MSASDDRVRLLHMRNTAQQALVFAEGASRDLLDQDTKLVFALVRAVEIIGEAASRISQDFHDAHPEIPWPLMVGRATGSSLLTLRSTWTSCGRLLRSVSSP